MAGEISHENRLARKYSAGTLFFFALPMILLQLWTGVYTMISSMFSAVYVSTDALAAVNMAYPILSIEEAIGGCIATGASVILAEKLGSGRKNEACRLLTGTVLWVFIIGLVWSVAVWLIGDPLYNMLGADDTLRPLIHEYYNAYVFFAAFYGLQIALQVILVAAGKPTVGLVVTICSGILNMIITWVSVAVARIGIVGVSLGEGGSAVIAVAVCLIALANKKDDLHLALPNMSLKNLVRSIYVGTGPLFYSIATSVMTILFNVGAITYFGPDGEAAGAILLYAQFLFVAAFIGFGEGTGPVIAYRFGCLNIPGLQDICKKYLKVFATIALIDGVLAFFMADPIMTLYGCSADDPVYEIAKGAWILFSVQYIFAGVNFGAQSLFAGVGDGKRSGFISALHALVLPVVFLIVLPQFMGGVGVWAALPVSEVISAVVAVAMILQGNKKFHYLPSKNPAIDEAAQTENDKKIAELKAQGIDIEEQALEAANEVE